MTSPGPATDKELAEALLKAVREQDAPLVRSLLDQGATPNGLDGQKEKPLHAAAYIGNLEIAITLVKAGANPAAQDARGFTPMEIAARRAEETFRFAQEPYVEVAVYLKKELDAAIQRAETERLQKETVAHDLAALKAHAPKRFRLKP